ncbi:unnamed protein product [Soboliphyme baturini]|uniref:Peptidase S1 domain-containing protein n=1 Tax=Soboliphyme baturini TaxID=241478 RepID=A0A183IC89_9BILA|nr:unnamed protein product [Soboliphyme baturini]
MVFGDDYKEAILKDIDADQLPVYYGGSCTSKDGDIKCSHAVSDFIAFKIGYGGIIPSELHYKDICRPDESELKTMTVNRGEDKHIELKVTEQHSRIAWYIKCTGLQDIGCGIFLKEDESQVSTEDMEMVTPYFRLLTHFVPDHGEFEVKRPGTCKFTVILMS